MARFVLLTDLPPTTARAAGRPTPTRVTWSLVSANNRSLGRAASIFHSVESCLAATELLRHRLDAVAAGVVSRDGESGGRRFWTWTLTLDDEPIAVAAARYARRFEADESVQRFLAVVPLASVAEPTLLRIGTRLGGRTGASFGSARDGQ